MLPALEVHDLVARFELGNLHHRIHVSLGFELAVLLVVRREELDVLLQVAEPRRDSSRGDDQQSLAIGIRLWSGGLFCLWLLVVLHFRRLSLHS